MKDIIETISEAIQEDLAKILEGEPYSQACEIVEQKMQFLLHELASVNPVEGMLLAIKERIRNRSQRMDPNKSDWINLFMDNTIDTAKVQALEWVLTQKGSL